MCQPAKILIVDDDPDFAETLRLTLASGPYTVVVATSGEEGLRKVQEEEPDLLILDVMMEEMVTGFKLVERLRDPNPDSEYAAYARVPLLLLSAIHQKTLFRFAPDEQYLPVDAFLEKPVDREELFACVEQLLTRPVGGRGTRGSGVQEPGVQGLAGPGVEGF